MRSEGLGKWGGWMGEGGEGWGNGKWEMGNGKWEMGNGGVGWEEEVVKGGLENSVWRMVGYAMKRSRSNRFLVLTGPLSMYAPDPV